MLYDIYSALKLMVARNIYGCYVARSAGDGISALFGAQVANEERSIVLPGWRYHDHLGPLIAFGDCACGECERHSSHENHAAL
jgi:hypothetical protein